MQADAVAAPSHGKSTPADDKGAAATPVEADEHFQQVQIMRLLIATSQGGFTGPCAGGVCLCQCKW